jgi:hypothetical protein
LRPERARTLHVGKGASWLAARVVARGLGVAAAAAAAAASRSALDPLLSFFFCDDAMWTRRSEARRHSTRLQWAECPAQTAGPIEVALHISRCKPKIPGRPAIISLHSIDRSYDHTAFRLRNRRDGT